MSPDTLPPPLLRVEQLVKRFGGFRALDGVSFHLARGEVLGLVGPNGSGKTTCINVISGLYPPDGGQVRVRGTNRSAARSRTVWRGAASIARSSRPKPFLSLTVRENVEVAADIRPRRGRTGRSRRAARVAGSRPARRTGRRAISTARSKRRSISPGRSRPRHACCSWTSLPPGSIPPNSAAWPTGCARSPTSGMALLVVEHLMGFIDKVTDRVIVMNAGREIFEGTARRGDARPEVVRVFLGGASRHERAARRERDRGRLRQGAGAVGRGPRVGERAGERRAARRQRRGQDDAPESAARPDAGVARRGAVRGRRHHAACAPTTGCGAASPTCRRSACSPAFRSTRTSASAASSSSARRCASADRGAVRHIPRTRGAQIGAGRRALGRPAQDARHRQGARRRAAAAGDGRALGRAVAAVRLAGDRGAGPFRDERPCVADRRAECRLPRPRRPGVHAGRRPGRDSRARSRHCTPTTRCTGRILAWNSGGLACFGALA